MPFPDVTALTLDYLRPLLTPVDVVTRLPQDSAPRERLVRLRRVGGTARPPVRDRARLDVFAWGLTDDDAMTLALQVREHLWALSGTNLLGIPCYEVGEFLGPRHSDDPISLTPRVWATYELTVRADDVIHPAPTI